MSRRFLAIRSTWGAGLVLLLCLSFTPLPAGAQSESLEGAIKATYLYKFGPFIGWPEGAFPPGGNALICTVGDEPFGDVLERAVKDQRLADRPIEVRRFRTVARGTFCPIMFIAGSAQQSAAEALQMLRGMPVLTVTDEALRTGDARGIIHFIVRENRVRFIIDDQAAADNGLAISSKLLSLAASVRPRARREP
jgi:hypothetical protein